MSAFIFAIPGNSPAWPVNAADLRAAYPSTIFPPDFSGLEDFHVYPVAASAPPEHDPSTHEAVEVAPEFAGDQWVQRWIIQELPTPAPEPRWQEFHDALQADSAIDAMLEAAPLKLALGLAVGLGQAAQGDSRTFSQAWSRGLAVGVITPELAAHVQGLAAGFDLPQEFVAGLNPVPS